MEFPGQPIPPLHQALTRTGTSLSLESVPTQRPEAGGLLIALEYVGVCGTDLQILNGSRPDVAPILGHEGTGIVALAGEGSCLRPGDRVVFNPIAQISTGQLLGHNMPGLFQQYLSIDAEAVDKGLVLPARDCSPPICAALAEPLGAVIYGRTLIGRIVPRLDTVVVFGAGPIGLLATRLLSAGGAKVFLVHTDQARLDSALRLELIAPDAGTLLSEDLAERLLSRNGGRELDAAVICTTRSGAPLALRHALELVKDGGCIDLITNFPEYGSVPERLNVESLRAVRAANVCGAPAEGVFLYTERRGRRIAITGHRGTSGEHLEKALQELQSRAASYRKLITHVLALQEAADAIGLLANSGKRVLHGRDCIKAVIDLSSSRTERMGEDQPIAS